MQLFVISRAGIQVIELPSIVVGDSFICCIKHKKYKPRVVSIYIVPRRHMSRKLKLSKWENQKNQEIDRRCDPKKSAGLIIDLRLVLVGCC